MRRWQRWGSLLLGATIIVSGCLSGGPARRPEDPLPGTAEEGLVSSPLAAASRRDPTPDLAGGPERTGRVSNPPPIPHQPARGVLLHGNLGRPRVALTFDDGPDRTFTPRVLDILRREGVRATFFMVGRRAAANPDVARRVIREGHEIGNHSWDHANLAHLAPADIWKNLARTDSVLSRLAARRITLFRAPYGESPAKVIDAATSLGYKVIMWNVDSLDWRSLPGLPVALHVLPDARWGSIILHHSAGGRGEDLSGTLDSLPLTIRTLKGQGYTFVSVSDLLGP